MVNTPNIDALAKDGILFEKAFAPTPVCSPTRSALITGYYPIRIGVQDHRSSRVPGYQIHLPSDVKTVPELFRLAGCETYNADKDDYNFVYQRCDLYSVGQSQPVIKGKTEAAKSEKLQKPANTRSEKTVTDRPIDDSAFQNKNCKGPSGSGDWRDVPDIKPFFGQMSVAGGKGVAMINTQLQQLGLEPIKPDAVRVPVQYPDIPQVRQHLAAHYNSILRTDHQIGETIARLKRDGRWENTIVFLFSDHGSDLPRSKEFVYEEGLRVPLFIAGPALNRIVKPGTRRSDIVNLMDVGATSLQLAGIAPPSSMDAKDLFDADYQRDYVFSSADRMSNGIDRVRSVMGPRFHYMKNYYTDRPLMNWGHREMLSLAAPERSSFLTIRALAERGKLTPAQIAPYIQSVPEELYDLQNGPDEVNNLATDPASRRTLQKMRAALQTWLEATDDKGAYPRSPAAMNEMTHRYPKAWLKSPEFTEQSSRQ